VKKKCILILLAVVMNFNFASCRMSGEYHQDEPQRVSFDVYKNDDDTMDKGPVRGGTLKMFSTYPDTLNPVLTNNTYVQDFSRLIFEGLVKVREDLTPVPVLADRWETSGDGLVWTFYMRDNVRWHDGTPLTAEDVEFTFETILSAASNSVYKKNLQNIATFAAIDKDTFRVVLKKPNSFTAELMTFPIIPKHYFSKISLAELPERMKPIGTGPYKFGSYVSDKCIKLVVNQNWWNSKSNNTEGYPAVPYISEVHINLYKNASDAIKAFQTKDVDVIRIDGLDYDKYNGRLDLTIKKYPGRNFEFIAFNLSSPILEDKYLRQAIAYAIDKEGLVKEFLPGKAVLSNVPLVPGTWINDSNDLSHVYDVKRAREILDKGGWKEGKDGLTKTINGVRRPLKLEMLVNEDNKLRCAVADRISEQLKKVGIDLKVTAMDWEEELKRIDAGKFDMVLIGCRVPSIPDVSYLYSYSYFLPILVSEADGGRNISGYLNQDVSKYIERIFSENDKDRKKALFLNMKQIIEDEVPYLGLYFYNNAVLYNKNIRGDLSPNVWDWLNNIAEWYIPEK